MSTETIGHGGTPVADPAAAAGATAHLARNELGPVSIALFVVAAAAPLSVMAGVGPLAIQLGGLGAPGGYLIGGLLMAVFAVGFVAMARHIPNAGAFYAYIGRGLGRPLGAGAALFATFAYNALEICFVGVFGYFAATTFAEVLGIDVAWQWWSALCIALIAFLGYRRVTLSATVLGVMLGLEVAILLVLAVPVILQGGETGLTLVTFDPANIFTSGVGALFVLSFGAFIGFESTAIYSEEARDPRRTVARATFLAVAFLGLFYTLIMWMIVVAFGPDGALVIATDDPAGMFFVAMDQYVGGVSTDVMRLLIVTSAFAATLAFHNAAARYHFALGREHILPRALARANPHTGAPAAGSLAQTVISIVVIGICMIIGADPYLEIFLWPGSMGILAVLALQTLCSLAVVAYFRSRARGEDGPAESVWATTIAPVAATIGLAITCYLIVRNFDLLTAASAGTNLALLLPLPVIFAAGVVRALQIKRTDPAHYEQLLSSRVD